MLFKIRYEHSNCSFEIVVNDMPVVTHYGLGERSGLTVAINQFIQKPGIQNVTVKFYAPKFDENTFAPNIR